jgi:hypothetical protein
MYESICRCQVRRDKENRNAKYSVGECHGQIPNKRAALCRAEAHGNNEASKKVGGKHQNGVSQQLRKGRQHLPIRDLTCRADPRAKGSDALERGIFPRIF